MLHALSPDALRNTDTLAHTPCPPNQTNSATAMLLRFTTVSIGLSRGESVVTTRMNERAPALDVDPASSCALLDGAGVEERRGGQCPVESTC